MPAPCAACVVLNPAIGLAGFRPILARTIELNEPRLPIGEFRFTEGYALLDAQKGISGSRRGWR